VWLCQGISVLTYFTLERRLAGRMIVVAHGMSFSSRAAKEEFSPGVSVAGMGLFFLLLTYMVLYWH